MEDLNIELQIAKQTDFIPQYVEILNTNSAALKDEIEKIVNNLKINTSTYEIGEADNPISKLVTNNVSIVDGGLSLTLDDTVIASLSINAEDESVLSVDELQATTVTISDAITVDEVTANESLTLDASATGTFSGDVSFARSFVSSYEWFSNSSSWLDMTYSSGDKRSTSNLILGKSSARHSYVVLNAESDTSIYETGVWKMTDAADEIWLALSIDENNPPEPGQIFNISLRDIVNNAGTSVIDNIIPANYDIIVKIVPGTDYSTSPGDPVEISSGAASITISNAGALRSDVQVQYLYDTVNSTHLFHIMNAGESTINY